MLTEVTELLTVHTDTVPRCHECVVCIRIIVWFHGTHVHVIWFKPLRKIQPSYAGHHKTHKCEAAYLQIPYQEVQMTQ